MAYCISNANSLPFSVLGMEHTWWRNILKLDITKWGSEGSI